MLFRLSSSTLSSTSPPNQDAHKKNGAGLIETVVLPCEEQCPQPSGPAGVGKVEEPRNTSTMVLDLSCGYLFLKEQIRSVGNIKFKPA